MFNHRDKQRSPPYYYQLQLWIPSHSPSLVWFHPSTTFPFLLWPSSVRRAYDFRLILLPCLTRWLSRDETAHFFLIAHLHILFHWSTSFFTYSSNHHFSLVKWAWKQLGPGHTFWLDTTKRREQQDWESTILLRGLQIILSLSHNLSN